MSSHQRGSQAIGKRPLRSEGRGGILRLKCSNTIFMFRFFSLLHGPDVSLRRGPEQTGAVNSVPGAGIRDSPPDQYPPPPLLATAGHFSEGRFSTPNAPTGTAFP